MNKKVIIMLLLVLAIPGILFAQNKVDINSASLEELDLISGIGPAIGQRIIDARPFNSLDDLDRVKGIGQSTLAKIKEQGVACVDCQTAITESKTPSTKSETNSNYQNSEIPNMTPVTYASGVVFNEILPNPKGSDETDEFAEIFNSNDFEVDLSGWKIKDTSGTRQTFTIKNGTKIPANGYLAFYRPETKIMLNNEGDGLDLIYPDGKTADSASFGKAPLGQSFNLISQEKWSWSNQITAGAKNIIALNKALPASTAPKALPAGLPKGQKSDTNDNINEGLFFETGQAGLIESNKTNPWPFFIIALVATLILSAGALFIKLKLHKTNVRT